MLTWRRGNRPQASSCLKALWVGIDGWKSKTESLGGTRLTEGVMCQWLNETVDPNMRRAESGPESLPREHRGLV